MSDFITGATYQLIWPDINNTVYTINGSNGLSHVSLDGTGVPPVARSYNNYVTSDGGIDDGFTLEMREMVWKLHIGATDEVTFDTARAYLFSVFRPLQDPYRLKVTRADGAIRQIDCFVNGPIEIELNNGFNAIATIPLIAPDPLWYHPTQQVVTFNTWPATTLSVPYAGSWYEWPIVKITGRIDTPHLDNTIISSTGNRYGKIDLRPNSVANGTAYTFDTRPTKKTMVNQLGANMLGLLPAFQYYPEFRLWPEPIKAGGTNVITLSHGTTGASAAIEFKYYNRYIGL